MLEYFQVWHDGDAIFVSRRHHARHGDFLGHFVKAGRSVAVLAAATWSPLTTPTRFLACPIFSATRSISASA
jgi:hypothetical protein